MKAVARAGSLAVSLLVAWCFFHGLARTMRTMTGEFQGGGALLQQLGMGVGGED